MTVGLSSGRLCRRSYSLVVTIERCPHHACTPAMAACWYKASVTAVVRSAWTITAARSMSVTFAWCMTATAYTATRVSGRSSVPSGFLAGRNSGPSASAPCPAASR